MDSSEAEPLLATVPLPDEIAVDVWSPPERPPSAADACIARDRRSSTRIASLKRSTERAVARCSRRRTQYWMRKAAQIPMTTTKTNDEGCTDPR